MDLGEMHPSSCWAAASAPVQLSALFVPVALSQCVTYLQDEGASAFLGGQSVHHRDCQNFYPPLYFFVALLSPQAFRRWIEPQVVTWTL